MKDFYSLVFKDSYGTEHRMSDYKGEVLLIVNTATKCGLAPQFEELQILHQDFKDKGLVVIGFPCDQFAGQEPETNESMAGVCKVNFGVTFLLSEKIDVNGKKTHPVFKYLKNNSGSFLGRRIKWNFTKFLISKDGKSITRYAPTTLPSSMREDITKYLSE